MSQVAVAVLTQPGAAAEQLRQALDTAGAEVVWEGPPDQLDTAQLPGDVVVVNLDPDTEAQMQRIEDLLADGTIRVVFNDATVSAGLSGWDLQRWARHLAAKVLDSSEKAELPSAPPGAEPLAVPAHVSEEIAGGDAGPVRLRVAGQQYIEDVISAELGEPPLPYEERQETPEPPAQATRPFPQLADIEDLEARASEPIPEPKATESMPAHSAGESGFAWSLEEMETSSDEEAEPPIAAAAAAMDAQKPAEIKVEVEDEIYLGGLSLEPIDDGSSTAEGGGESGSDLQFTDDLDLITAGSDEGQALPEDLIEAAAAADEEGTKAGEADAFGFGDLQLEPLELPEDAEVQHAGGAQAAPAPAAVTAPVPALPRQLWILAGALGAAEAIGQFFNALPERVDATFLVVTHFDRGSADSLARSLGASGRREVNVAARDQGRTARAGVVLVAPESTRVRVGRDGEVVAEALDSPIGVIDHCARAAADAFGMDAGIIVFSGGARDGFEGCLYVAQRGGVVWAQDPATCVAGAMAESVKARGLATFLGSPRGLAEHFAQEFG